MRAAGRCGVMLACVTVASVAKPVGARAEPPAKLADGFAARTLVGKSTRLQLPYRLHVPPSYDKQKRYPLLLFLHGAGERGTDNESQLWSARGFADPALQARHPAFVVAPQCPSDRTWVNTGWTKGSYSIDEVELSEPAKAVMELVAAIQQEFSIDPRRVIVVGMSMGGYGAWDLALRFPGTFATALPVCGAGDPSKAALLKQTRVWAFHGENDPVVPVAGSRAMVAALKAAGAKVKYTEYPGATHNVWTTVYNDPKVLEWLLGDKR